MSTMPNFVGFSLNYAIQKLVQLKIVPGVEYEIVAPPQDTMGLVTAQSPPAGDTIMGPVSLTVTGGVKIPGVGVTCLSAPAILVGNDDNPGGMSTNQ